MVLSDIHRDAKPWCATVRTMVRHGFRLVLFDILRTMQDLGSV